MSGVASLACMEGLIWTGGTTGPDTPQTTKSGAPIYGGSAFDFSEWEFRVMAKHDALAGRDDEAQQQTELAGKVLEGLQEGALRIAMDLGRSVVISPTGIPRLVEEIREFVKERAV